jgi:hypothetical protein
MPMPVLKGQRGKESECVTHFAAELAAGRGRGWARVQPGEQCRAEQVVRVHQACSSGSSIGGEQAVVDGDQWWTGWRGIYGAVRLIRWICRGLWDSWRRRTLPAGSRAKVRSHSTKQINK